MVKIKEWYKNNQSLILVILSIFIAATLRKSLIYFVGNSDYVCCLKPWYDHILDNGGIYSLRTTFSDYPPLYLLMLVITSTIFGDSGYKPYGIKLIPISFDFLTAFFVYKIVQMKYKDGKIPIYAAMVILFAPSIFVVSSFWGQNDILYITGLVAFIYFLFKDKEFWAFVSLGFSFSIKLQTVFIAPLLLILLLKKRVGLKYFFLIPFVYFLSLVPSIIVGKPISDLILIYFNQTLQFPDILNLNAPSIYAWLQHVLPPSSYLVGSIVGLLILIILVIVLVKEKIIMGRRQIVTLAFLSMLITPFLLPKMHERYFLAADVFAVLFAFYNPKYFYVPVIMIFSSLISYIPFLFQASFIPMEQIAIFLGIMILVIVLNWRELLFEDEFKHTSYEKNK